MIEIKLKKKYLTRTRSKHRAVGDDNNKRIKRPGATGPVEAYNPRDHVLLIKDNKRTFLHYEDARAVLGE